MSIFGSAWDFVTDPFDIFHDEDPNDATLTPSNIQYAGTRGITESEWRSYLPLNRESFLANWRRQDAEGKPPTVFAPVEVQGSWSIIGESVVEQAEAIGDSAAAFGEGFLDTVKKYGVYIAVGAGVVVAIVLLK